MNADRCLLRVNPNRLVRLLPALAAAAVVLSAPFAPAARAAEGDGKPTVTVSFPEGGLTIASGQNSISIGMFGQFRWTGTDREDYDADASGTSGFGEGDSFDNLFNIPRLRVSLQGTVYRTWFRYRLEYELSNTTGEASNKIKDGYVEANLKPVFAVRFGQYKAPFGLQQITSDAREEFVERAITDRFTPARDEGIMVHGALDSKTFGWAGGVFNGGGESRVQDDSSLMWVGRAYWDPLGEYKLSESPLENPESMILHFGVAVHTGETARGTATPGVFENPDDETAYGAEFAWRIGKIWATAEYFLMSDEQDNPAGNPTLRTAGWHAQAGWMPWTRPIEVAARYALVNPDRDAADDTLTEARVGVNYYVKGHNLKAQWDVGYLEFPAGYAGLSAIAVRNLPQLGTRIGPPETWTDWQSRFQAAFSF